ncbi:ArsR/SmtB family transcription factor [Woodsholea maritima]|uniref:ArsR/SmtB family transcription factor n=1 Tax=Woodsholea maritima TaxID=240237 RepID=UPI00038156EE|nr:helix-turn-helix transcriptional regulator [Woodsholea maritima]
MRLGPDIARIASLIGDPARANMLSALMSGMALSASELAEEAGITRQTATSHLKQLEAAHLITIVKQGRHRYARLAHDEVGETLERLLALAYTLGHTRTRPGPKDPHLRHARICYDHLAGARGVCVMESCVQRGFLSLARDGELSLTPEGADFFTALGLNITQLSTQRRALCRSCLDWSERRFHLAGGLGAGLLTHMKDHAWLRQRRDSRILDVTPKGELEIGKHFPEQ